MDRSKIVVYFKCTLNIIKEYSQSDLTYLITKGDIESTIVRIIIEGKELIPLVNATKVPNDQRNPLLIKVPVKQYMHALEARKKAEKMVEKPKEEIEPEKEEMHIIITTFNELFRETLKKEEPTENEVEEVFEWLRSHGENAAKFLEADIYRDLTLRAEAHFWKFLNLKKKKIRNEASKTLKKISKRYDNLRKIQGKFAIQTPYLGGVEKEEQKVAPKE
jgi:vacuolar-type H+-ATPase subunit H